MFLYKVSDLSEEDPFDYQGRQIGEPLTVNFLEYCFDRRFKRVGSYTKCISIDKFFTSVLY